MAKSEQVVTIEPASARGGLRGRIEKLQREYLMKSEALRIAGEILDADERQNALDSAPKKFLQAMNRRQAAAVPAKPAKRQPARKATPRLPAAERMEQLRRYIGEHPGQSTNQIADGLGIKRNLAFTFARMVAIPVDKKKTGKMMHWVLKKNAAESA